MIACNALNADWENSVTSNNGKTIGITTILAIVAAIGANIKAIAEGMMGLWLVLLAFSDKAPLGLSSFLLSLILAMLILPPWRFIVRRRFSSIEADAELRRFIAGCIALLVALLVMLAQLPTLQGGLLGIVAGLFAPWLLQGLQALGNAVARMIR